MRGKAENTAEAPRRAWLAGEKPKLLFFRGGVPAADGRITESCRMGRFTVDEVQP